MASPIQHHQPGSLETALDFLGRFRTDVAIIAGGTAIVPQMRDGNKTVGNLVSLGRVKGLGPISYIDSDGLVIGAGAKVADVAVSPDVLRFYPALAQACAQMANPQVRNMATVAGNLANASPAADCAAPLMAHGGSVVLVERGGPQAGHAGAFIHRASSNRYRAHGDDRGHPGAPLRPSALARTIYALPPAGACGRLILGVAGLLSLDADGNIIRSRLAISGAAPTPVRANEAEGLLDGMAPDETLLARAAAACVRSTSPADDHLATAFYRRMMTQVLARRVLLACLEMARREL